MSCRPAHANTLPQAVLARQALKLKQQTESGLLQPLALEKKAAALLVAGENSIHKAGRNTMGVKLVNLDAVDKLQAIAPVISEDKAEVVEGSEPAK